MGRSAPTAERGHPSGHREQRVSPQGPGAEQPQSPPRRGRAAPALRVQRKSPWDGRGQDRRGPAEGQAAPKTHTGVGTTEPAVLVWARVMAWEPPRASTKITQLDVLPETRESDHLQRSLSWPCSARRAPPGLGRVCSGHALTLSSLPGTCHCYRDTLRAAWHGEVCFPLTSREEPGRLT